MFAAGFLGGTVSASIISLALLAGLRRRCTTMEWALGDLQDRASTFKGREMAEKRWTKEKNFEAELAQALHTGPTTKRKYDNDPLGE